MITIARLFSLVFRLYPARFRARFASEMDEVFRAGLEDAREQGTVPVFLLRESLHLCPSMVGAYMWSMSTGEGRQVAVSSMGGGTVGMSTQGDGWGAAVMAGIPHLLVGILVVISEIFASASNNQTSIIILLILYIAIVIGVLVYNLLKGWKSWSGSWIIYLGLIAIVLFTRALTEISASWPGSVDWLDAFQFVVLPLLIAYLLYKIACPNRLWGILSAIPVMAIIWAIFQEFVPVPQKVLAWGWIFLLAFAAAALILRAKQSWAALGLAMMVPTLGGLPFAYLGVYEGGTLPFSQPGPSLLEAFRQYLPVLVMALAIVLGPQLAVQLRTVGKKYGEAGGKIYYRLTLAGILSGLVFSLMEWVTGSTITNFQSTLQLSFLSGGIALFLVGFAWLFYAVWKGRKPESDNSDLLHLGALFLPLLFLPLVILLVRPVVMAHSTNNWLIYAAEIAWVVAAGLVAKD